MLNDYSSLLEVITAAYFSMCIEQILKAVWTPKYHDKVQKLVDATNIPMAKKMSISLDDHITIISADINRHMKIKSVFMLIVCLALLATCGLENHLHWLIVEGNEQEIVARFSFLLLFVILLGNYLFRRLSYIFGVIIGVTILLFLSYSFLDSNLLTEYFKLTENRVVFSLLGILFLPILWQIFLCWVYSSLYYGYLFENTTKEKAKYELALLSVRIRQVAAAPDEYKECVARELENPQPISESGKPEEIDSSCALVHNRFVERMEDICRFRNVIVLILSCIRHHWIALIHPERVVKQKERTKDDKIFENAYVPQFNEYKSVNKYNSDNGSKSMTDTVTTEPPKGADSSEEGDSDIESKGEDAS